MAAEPRSADTFGVGHAADSASTTRAAQYALARSRIVLRVVCARARPRVGQAGPSAPIKLVDDVSQEVAAVEAEGMTDEALAMVEATAAHLRLCDPFWEFAGSLDVVATVSGRVVEAPR